MDPKNTALPLLHFDLNDPVLDCLDDRSMVLISEAAEAIKVAIKKITEIQEYIKHKAKINTSFAINGQNPMLNGLLGQHSIISDVPQLETSLSHNLKPSSVKPHDRVLENFKKGLNEEGYNWNLRYIFDTKKTIRFRIKNPSLSYEVMFTILHQLNLYPRALKVANKNKFSCGYISFKTIRPAQKLLGLQNVFWGDNVFQFTPNPDKKKRKNKNTSKRNKNTT